MNHWFDIDPSRLEFELEWLDWAGFPYSILDDGRESGFLTLSVTYPDPDHEDAGFQGHPLTVTFPPNYPAFPFRILAPTFPRGTHVNPAHELCLLENPGDSWNGSRDFLVAFLNKQVKDILRAHRGDDTVLEAQEGLRQTGYVNYSALSFMVTGDWVIPPGVKRGYLSWKVLPSANIPHYVRGCVAQIQSETGDSLGDLSMGVHWDGQLRGIPDIAGRWLRLETIPNDPNDILKEAREEWPGLEKTIGVPDLIGLLIPEEKNTADDILYNWVFITRMLVPMLVAQAPQAPQAFQITTDLATSVIRAEQFSPETRWARTPRTQYLESKKAVVVGLGAIGSPLAWQLARSGIGELVCVDCDSVQIGNIPRWLYGFSALGDRKAACIANNLQQQYPPLRATSIDYKVGVAEASTAVPYEQFLASIASADIVIDATAEVSINRYLESLAREHGIPYVWAYASNGGWGGVVGRSIPGATLGCYECFQYHMIDAVNARAAGAPVPDGGIDLPPAEDKPDVQPVGCFHPTFRGTGFDLDQVSQLAARLAVATLGRDAPDEDKYQDFTWDIAVLSQWDPTSDQPTVPNWKTHSLDRHQSCQHHDD
ncbi:HesA/MoeB/ThiF family protein [Acidihalobacter yilgarnensis]|uniref:HesA/MoeB/ThiF family protein n=1 Tax=Acidihalobacter yilgarnensis TaxID=2819280 RepID=UPI0009F218BA|nr:ThiF family adenylyltransferase [Acidihalobacter yilgarnensis]